MYNSTFNLLFLLAGVIAAAHASSTISPILVNSGHIYAETNVNRVDLNQGNVTLRWKSFSGAIQQEDYIQLRFPSFRDEIDWVSSANSTRCNPYVSPSTPLEGWRAWTSPGPNGTVLIGMNVTFSSNCDLAFILYLTNEEKSLKFGNFSVPLKPSEAKLSVVISCPWKTALSSYPNSGYTATSSAWLIARRLAIGLDAEVKLSSFLSGFPVLEAIDMFLQDDYITLRNWSALACSGSTPAPAPNNRVFLNSAMTPKPLPSDFDFTDVAGFFYQTETLRTGLFFLGWAVSDNQFYTEVRASSSSLNPVGAFGLKASFDLSLTFADSVLYDPTMEFLFFDSVSATPGSSPAVIQAVLQENSNIATIAGVCVTVGVVVAVSTICIIYYVQKKRENRNRETLKRKLNPETTVDDSAARLRSSTNAPVALDDSRPSRSDSSPGKWQSGNVRSSIVSNT